MSPLQAIRLNGEEVMADVEDILQKKTFEFDAAQFHFRHCFYSIANQNKESAIVIISKMLLIKFR